LCILSCVRYPQFTDALADLDDPLSMIYLFASLPSKLAPEHSSDRVALCSRLSREWEIITARTRTLEKVFVSIKGIYYQSVVKGQAITWLAPHQFKQNLPEDVDYRVMLTFLQFYECLVKFVNFKLFFDEGLHYPPRLDEQKEASRQGVSAMEVSTIEQHRSRQQHIAGQGVQSNEESKSTNKELQKLVSSTVALLLKQGNQEQQDRESNVDGDNENVDDFSALDPSAPRAVVSELPNNFFKGFKFLLAREVPFQSLEFVVLCGGGEVVVEGLGQTNYDSDSTITHHVADRPSLRTQPTTAREIIQPQWVFDSFNCKTPLPVFPYRLGVRPPPHLSPFADVKSEGVYIPEQAAVLEQWVREATGTSANVPASAPGDAEAEDSDDAEEELLSRTKALEDSFSRDLNSERKGKTFSEQQSASEDDGEASGDDGESDDLANEENEGEEKEASSEEEPNVVPLSKKQLKEQQQKSMAAMMMTSKTAKLHARVTGFKEKQAEEKAKLTKRKQMSDSAPAKVIRVLSLFFVIF
jgi:pescadillo protein